MPEEPCSQPRQLRHRRLRRVHPPRRRRRLLSSLPPMRRLWLPPQLPPQAHRRHVQLHGGRIRRRS
ncbi:unnamed protein product [Linum tenue]|uniref:Uncharacterized protein n=1 Tax=Linum tenue TaxID=586396 RepID=A0AAV0IRB4_9ROSI|nr:unnamed protein product [Linum tenue]